MKAGHPSSPNLNEFLKQLSEHFILQTLHLFLEVMGIGVRRSSKASETLEGEVGMGRSTGCQGGACQVLEWWVGLEAGLIRWEGGRRGLEVLEVASASGWRLILIPHWDLALQ